MYDGAGMKDKTNIYFYTAVLLFFFFWGGGGVKTGYYFFCAALAGLVLGLLDSLKCILAIPGTSNEN